MSDAPQTLLVTWASAAWRTEMTAWVDDRLAENGIQRTGEPEAFRLRAWGAIYRIPTAAGPFWFKAPAPATAFEVGLYDLLARTAPDLVLTPLATDLKRGWLLLPDGGQTLYEVASGPALVDRLVAILPAYGQLQRDLASEVDAMLALGVTDMRATTMPARFDEAHAAVETWGRGHGTAADRDLLDRIANRRGTYLTWCQQLADVPVAPSLDHHDLHANNVLASGNNVVLSDWGDAVVGHPFASLLVLLGFVRHYLQMDSRDPAVRRVRDAYLDVFSDLAPHRDLVAAGELACRVGKVTRCLIFVRALAAANDPAHPYAREPLVWLAGVLEDDPLDTG